MMEALTFEPLTIINHHITFHMKKQILFLLTLFVFALGACKKDDSTDPGANSDGFYLQCKIDGRDFVAGDNLAYWSTFGSDQYSIYGSASLNGHELVAMTLENTLGVGTHQFAPSDEEKSGWYVTSNSDDYDTYYGQGRGSVTITRKDADVIEGTFSFTPYESDDEVDKVEITEGKFRVQRR